MIQELLYTSAPRGLKPGSRGFCTVLSSQGMAAPLASALEGLSGYRPVFPPGDPQARLNPVAHAHLILPAQGKRYSVLSRVADYGLDYSQRTNKLAHHVVLEPADRPVGGPAWLLLQTGFLRTKWDEEPRIVPAGRAVPRGDVPPGVCRQWERVTGNAGWAGVLAESFLDDPERLVYLTFSPGLDPLPLIAEAIALLPPDKRWGVTFSTYYTNLPQGVTCNWRCVLADSPEANQSRRHVRSLRLTLGEPLGRASGGELVEAARTGVLPMRMTANAATSDSHPPPEAVPEEDGPLRLQRPSLPAPPRRRADLVNVHEGRREQTGRRRRRSPVPWMLGVLVLPVLIGTIAFIALRDRARQSRKETSNQVAVATPVPEPPKLAPPGPLPAVPAMPAEAAENSNLPGEATMSKAPDQGGDESPPATDDGHKTADTQDGNRKLESKDKGEDKHSQQTKSGENSPPPEPTVTTQYVSLPTAKNQGTNEEVSGKARTTLIDKLGSFEDVPTMSLFVPPEYADMLDVTPSNTQNGEHSYTVQIKDHTGAPYNLATFHLASATNGQSTYQLDFQWTGNDANWDVLRWCVLQIRSGQKGGLKWRFVLHEESGEPTGWNGERIAEWPLPPHKLKVFSDKGPTLRLEKLTVTTKWNIEFDVSNARNLVAGKQLTLESPRSIFDGRFNELQIQEVPVSTRVLIEESNGIAQKLAIFQVNEGETKRAFDRAIDASLLNLPSNVRSKAESAMLKVQEGWFKNGVWGKIEDHIKKVSEKKKELATAHANSSNGDDNRKSMNEDEFDKYVQILENLRDDSKTFHEWQASLKNARVSRIKVTYIVKNGDEELPVTVIDHSK